MIIESFGRDISPWSAIVPALKSELPKQLPVPIEIHETELEAGREYAPAAESAFVQYLRSLFDQHPPDLVIPVGGVSAQFWWRHRQDLFPSVPVVIGGIESRLLNKLTLSTNDTAVAAKFDPRAGLEIILHILPDTTNIVVVTGDSLHERFWITEIEQAWRPLTNRAQLSWFNKLPLPEMIRQAANLPPRTAIAYGSLWADAAGVAYEQSNALDQLSEVANVPMFGFFEDQLGHGIVGGRLLSGAAIGRESAKAAARVLSGESPETVRPPVLSASPPTFDWRQLQRWGIERSQLPSGSTVLFRQPSAWERYRYYITAALAIMFLQGMTIVALLAQRSRRRRAEAGLSESRLFMELATVAGELGLWVGNATRSELWVNAPLRTIFELPEDSMVVWKNLLDRIHPEDRARAESAIGCAMNGGGTFEFDGRLRRPDGTEKWITARGMAAKDSRGRSSRVQGIVMDITSRHRAELEAQRHRNELLHIGRVHVLGQLSCALAHELNQPLAAILSNAEAAELLLKNGSPAEGELLDILADIRKDNQRASDVIQRLRALLSRHEMQPATLVAVTLLRECIELAKPNALERHVTVTWEVVPETLSVFGDRVHLQQVLLNLLVNGMDAMRDCLPEKRRLLVTAKLSDDRTALFSVQDAGSGIPPGELERIFDLFHTTKSNGLGVGLSISRTIIEAHNGRIWAENNPDAGATVRFTLPQPVPDQDTTRTSR